MSDPRGSAKRARRAGPSAGGPPHGPVSPRGVTPVPMWAFAPLQEPLAAVLEGLVRACGGRERVLSCAVYAFVPGRGELRGVAGLLTRRPACLAYRQLWCRVMAAEDVPAARALRTGRAVVAATAVSPLAPTTAAAREPERAAQPPLLVALPVPAPGPAGERRRPAAPAGRGAGTGEHGAGTPETPAAPGPGGRIGPGPAGVLVVGLGLPGPLAPSLMARLRAYARRVGAELARHLPVPLAEDGLRPPGPAPRAPGTGTGADGQPPGVRADPGREPARAPGHDPAATAPGAGGPPCGGGEGGAACRPGAEHGHPGAPVASGPAVADVLRALEASGTGTYDWDLTTGRLVMDARGAAFFGARGRFAGPAEAVLCSLHPDDYPVLRMDLARALLTGGTFASSHRLVRGDGGLRWLAVRGRVDDDESGPRLRGLVTDVTDLDDVRPDLVRTAEHVQTSVLVLDAERRVVYANAFAERVLGRPRADIAGRVVDTLLPFTDRPAWAGRVLRAFRERRPVSFVVSSPVLDRTFHVSTWPRGDQSVCVCVDISDARERAERRRAQARRQAARQARLQLLTAALAESLTVREVARALPRLASLCEADGVVIGLLRDGRLRVAGQCGHAREVVERLPVFGGGDDAPVTEAMRTRREVAISVTGDHPPGAGPAALARATGRRSWVFWPLVSDDEVIGACALSYDAPGVTGPDPRLARRLRGLLARALHRARRYDDEHAMSAGLQRGLLPARPASTPGLTVATRYLPATAGMRISGDWHDVIRLPDGGVGLVIGDVQGHDVDAAGAMSVLRTAFLAYAVEGHGPAEVVRRTNALSAGMGTDVLATCAYVRVDVARARATAVRAGHPNPVVVGGAGARLLDLPGGLPLGIDVDARYPATEISLAPGETIALYTDGLVEARGLSLDDGTAALLARLDSGRAMGPDELAGHVLAGREGFLGDDVALLLARLDPRPPGAAAS